MTLRPNRFAASRLVGASLLALAFAATACGRDKSEPDSAGAPAATPTAKAAPAAPAAKTPGQIEACKAGCAKLPTPRERLMCNTNCG